AGGDGSAGRKNSRLGISRPGGSRAGAGGSVRLVTGGDPKKVGDLGDLAPRHRTRNGSNPSRAADGRGSVVPAGESTRAGPQPERLDQPAARTAVRARHVRTDGVRPRRPTTPVPGRDRRRARRGRTPRGPGEGARGR